MSLTLRGTDGLRLNVGVRSLIARKSGNKREAKVFMLARNAAAKE
jgi:hypothetical protein